MSGGRFFGNILNEKKDPPGGTLTDVNKVSSKPDGPLDVLVLLDTRLTRRHWLPKDGLIKPEPFSAVLLYGLMDPVDGAV